MHVASLSKIVTAIAVTRLLDEAGIAPSTPIIDYLPGYWAKGPIEPVDNCGGHGARLPLVASPPTRYRARL